MLNGTTSKWIREDNPIAVAALEIKQINSTINELLADYNNLVKTEKQKLKEENE